MIYLDFQLKKVTFTHHSDQKHDDRHIAVF